MTVTRQFAILIAVPLLLVIALVAVVGAVLTRLSTETTRLVDSLHYTAELGRALAEGNSDQIDAIQGLLAAPDPARIEQSRRIAYDLSAKYSEYLKLDIDNRERLTVERAKSLQAEANVLSTQILEYLAAGDSQGVANRVQRLYGLQNQVRTEFDTLNGLQIEKLRATLDQLVESATRGLLALVALLIALLAAAGATSYALRRRIVMPVRAILDASDRMRRGDFTARAPALRADEFGELTTGFNFMAESLAQSYASLEQKVDERTRQLRDMQSHLVRAEKMSAVGLLVSGVAHELNNPLATIRGYSELARMEIAASGAAPNAVRLLDDVDGQIERCRRIIGNLLQFARQQDHRVEPLDANAVVDQVLRLREYELETQNVTVVRDFDPANPRVSGDRDRLQQVFLNLLNNAHDAIRERGGGGTIRVRTRGEPGYVTFEFFDTGTGFRDAERAFDPFYTTKDVGQGTGLGLSVCHGIVEDHNGRIRAGNWEEGAVVTVCLPVGDLSEEPAGSEPAATTAAPARSEAAQVPLRPTALVVEDEPMLARLQATYLARMAITAVTVATGDDAVQYLRTHDVDMVISDVRMPGSVDGVQLFEWVREHRPALTARFLFVSGDLVGLNLGDFFERHAVPRIEKPFRLEEYQRQVRQILDAHWRPA